MRYRIFFTGFKAFLFQIDFFRSLKGSTKSNTKAFTLIEVLLYIGGLSIMIFGITLFMGMLTEARIKNQVIAEVEQQGANIVYHIAQMVRSADEIISPVSADESQTLILNLPEEEAVISLNGAIMEAQLNQVSYALNSGRVQVQNLIFRNPTPSSEQGLISASFTLSHTNPSRRYPYNYQQNFYLSAALRP